MILEPVLTQEMFEKQVLQECNEFLRHFNSEIEKERSKFYAFEVKAPSGFRYEAHFEIIKNMYLAVGWKSVTHEKRNYNSYINFSVLDNVNIGYYYKTEE
jgi:hypothetical protein